MSFVNTVDVIGDNALTDSIIDRTITEIADNMTTSIGSYAFYYCDNLTTVNFHAATSIGSYAFQHCSALTTVNFHAATSIVSYAFQYCYALEMADFPAATSIGNSAFGSCSQLTALILRSEAMATLNNTNAFTITPIASGTGYIYVPRALLSDTDATQDYRRATNWSTYAAQFRALEDYTVDGTVKGELDPNKI